MLTLPTKLLRDVYWSFAEPVPSSPDELVEALREYAAEINVPDPLSKLLQSLPFSEVCIQYSYGYRTSSGEWLEETRQLRVVAPTASRLTGAELLWELHVACHATVGADDHHFFEGLELVSKAGSGTHAVYAVILGS